MCAFISANLFQPYYWFVRNLRITDTANSYASMQAAIAKVSKVLQATEKAKELKNQKQ